MVVENIVNLTRKTLPKLSKLSKENIESINAMPEMVLARMMREGDKSILRVDMNQCGGAIISPNGISTVFTDGLAGCNSVGVILQLKDKRKLCILSHYVPTNVEGQTKALEKQLQVYEPYLDKNYKPKIFFNIRGNEDGGILKVVPNKIVENVKSLFSTIFKNIESFITPYKTQNRPAFFSSANIFQFSPTNPNKLKITNVGEQEKFIDLTV